MYLIVAPRRLRRMDESNAADNEEVGLPDSAAGPTGSIDRGRVRLHNRPMNDSAARTAIDQEMRKLEKRMEELLATVNHLKEENRALRQKQDALMTERATLLQKNEQVRARVEAMIGRLKAMEHNA